MRDISIGFGILLFAGSALAQASHPVAGYYRSNGIYVAPHYQTNPNGTTADNWSTKGNVNPYTGQPGTRNLTPSYGTPAYPAPSLFAHKPAPTYGSSYGQPPTDSSFGQPAPQPNPY